MENKKSITGDVVHVVYDELSRNYTYYENKNNKLDKRLQIVSVDNVEKLFDDNSITLMNGRPYEGQILLRHPFAPNTYIDANCSQLELFQDKANRMSHILQLLGVKSVTFNAQWIEKYKRIDEGEGHIGIKKFGASGNYEHSSESNEFNSIDIQKDYNGAHVTPEMYAQAIEFAKRNGLYNDTNIQYFINSRNPAIPNLQKRDKLKVELSKEFNELTKIAFSLNFLKVFELDFDYKTTLETMNKVVYEWEIQF